MDHLNKVKQKLEVTLDELEDSHEREKKSRLDMEKQRYKMSRNVMFSNKKCLIFSIKTKDRGGSEGNPRGRH